jgi:hypothetical protein
MVAVPTADEPVPSKLTDNGAGPAADEEEITAVGGVGATTGSVTETDAVAMLLEPVLLVMVSLAV